jgi:hypothetical protein
VDAQDLSELLLTRLMHLLVLMWLQIRQVISHVSCAVHKPMLRDSMNAWLGLRGMCGICRLQEQTHNKPYSFLLFSRLFMTIRMDVSVKYAGFRSKKHFRPCCLAWRLWNIRRYTRLKRTYLLCSSLSQSRRA